MMAAPPSTYGIINMVGGLHVWQWCWLNWQGNCLDYWNFWSRKSGSLMADWGGGGGGVTTISCQSKKKLQCVVCTVCHLQYVTVSCFYLLYLAVSSSGLPVQVFALKRALDTQAWSAFGRLCFKSCGSRTTVKYKYKL